MCGISGIIDFSNKSSVDILQKMNRTMVHRGPDGEGYSFESVGDVQVGLGHRRLSIIDLSAGGTQPMHFGNYSILLNGEIYNYQEIKDALIAKHHSFVSTSDTEVVLHAYIEWGKDFLEKLIGMFAIVIVDKAKNEIFGCRDRVGVKPFFYYWHQDLFLFTSELKAFHEHPNFIKQVNIASVATYLQYGYINAPYCIFEHCSKLLPGHYFYLDLKTKKFTTHQYWNVYDYYNKPKLDISFEEAKQETEKILTKAFQYRMVADVPVGVFLSGGYDSTCVTALLQKNSSTPLKTFTIGVASEKLDEAPFAKEIANKLGTNHTEYYCTEKDILNLIEDLPFYYDEPFADSSALPTTLVSQIARKDVTVALSADAGDEIFAGYNRYDYVSKYLGKIKKIPSPIRSLIVAGMQIIPAKYIPIIGKDPLISHRYKKLKDLIQTPDVKALMKSMTADINDVDVKKLIKQAFTSLQTAHSSKELDKAFFDDVTYMMAIDFQTYLPDDIMQKVDRAAMSVSLEGREPFLDQHVIQWAAQLPTAYKYNNGNKKYILKEIVHNHIPKTLMDRPKMGFAIPIAKWLKNDLKDIVEQFLNDKEIAKYGILEAKEVANYKKYFYAGNEELAPKIWYLLMLQMWCKKWM
jgi:asparagine synthase (glutamine-hydrolysing)